MIVTPNEILNWINKRKNFTVIDIRPSEFQNNDPILGLKYKTASKNLIPKVKNDLIIVCQYGVVTEGLILEKKLINSYSLLGGSEAWNEFYKSNSDFSRYSRQMILPELGLEGQKKIIDSSVAVVGMGGLGCPASQSLVISGVGRLVIVDGDKVEFSNLHRQSLYNIDDVGCCCTCLKNRKCPSMKFVNARRQVQCCKCLLITFLGWITVLVMLTLLVSTGIAE